MTYAERTTSINLHLAVAVTVNRHGCEQSLRTIASICGCDQNLIYLIERKALRKLRLYKFPTPIWIKELQ